MTAPAPARWRHPVVGRSAWTLGGQAASSGSNFLLALAILATADRRQFAAFSVVLTGYLLVTQLTRSSFSVPVLVLYSDHRGAAREVFGPPVGAAVATGLVGSAVLLGAGAAYPQGRTLFFVLAAALPFLQYQDAVRHVAFARGVPEAAAASDALWVGGQLAASGGAALAGRASPTVLFVAWAVAGSLSGLLFGRRLRVAPVLGRAWAWLRANRALCQRVAGEFLVNSGSFYLLSYGLVAIAGADELGRWRAAQALIGPVSVLLLGGTTLGVPESARFVDRPAALRRFAGLLSVGMAAVAVAGGALAYALLPAVGPSLFPKTWETARPVLPVLTAFAAMVGASAGAVAGLRVRGHAGWILRARAASAAVSLALGLPLAAALDAEGALAGLAVAEAAFAVASWARLGRALAAPPPEPARA